MTEITALGRRTLHGEIVAAIRDMIVSGKLEPGQKIPEKELCVQLEISRTPLREALKALAAEGVIELLPQRGARVAVLTDEELDELFPIIGSMEALAGELACQHMTAAQLEAITAMHHQMIVAYGNEDRLEYGRLNRAIHFAIFEAAGNRSLLALYRNLEQRIWNIRHTARKQPTDWRQALLDHDEIMGALAARDGQRLAGILRRHVGHTADSVRSSISDLVERGMVDAKGRAAALGQKVG
ncbi:MAG: GntR family transcriptional regulator [Azospirillaceae bacterium]|nr:GntR family transcriptional regulator [Azospirillaceae bacterium]